LSRSNPWWPYRGSIEAFGDSLNHGIPVFFILWLGNYRFRCCSNFGWRNVFYFSLFVNFRLVYNNSLTNTTWLINCWVGIVEHRRRRWNTHRSSILINIYRYILCGRDYSPLNYALVSVRHSHTHNVGISRITQSHTLLEIVVICSDLRPQNLWLQHRLWQSNRASCSNPVVLDRNGLRICLCCDGSIVSEILRLCAKGIYEGRVARLVESHIGFFGVERIGLDVAWEDCIGVFFHLN